jgi:hypothetical protein
LGFDEKQRLSTNGKMTPLGPDWTIFSTLKARLPMKDHDGLDSCETRGAPGLSVYLGHGSAARRRDCDAGHFRLLSIPAHARATAKSALSLPGSVAQPSVSMNELR